MVERTVPDILPVTADVRVGLLKGSRLCNFVTGESFLLLSHQAELDKILEVIRQNPGHFVEIEGFASRAGDAGFNRTISEKRAQNVRAHLERGVNKLNVTVFTAFGEDESGGGERNNDGIFRAVTVRVFANKPAPKPTPPPVEEKDIQHFAIRISSMASLSIPILKLGQLDLFVFFIVDRDRKLGASYQYTGGAGAPPSPFSISPVSFADKGPWTFFRVQRHNAGLVRVILEDFADKANLIQTPGAQIATQGVGQVQLTFESDKIKKKNCGVIPGGLNLQGGSGFQLPSAGSIGFGTLSLIGDVEAFTGAVVEGAITP